MKQILAMAMALLLVLNFTGCDRADKTPEKIVFTYVESPLNIPSIVEKELGYFEKAFGKRNIDVDYAAITSGSQQTQALAAGEVQFLNAVGATSVLLSAAAGTDICIVGGYSRSPGAYCIVTMNDDFQTAKDLTGKTVGGPKGTTLNELLVAWLAQSGMKQEDVEYLTLSVADAFSALLSGSIDAALLAGPTAYSAVQKGGRILANGDGLIDGTVLLAASRSFCDKNPDCVEIYLNTQREILAYIQENEAAAVAITAEAIDLPVEAVEEMLSDYTFFLDIEQRDVASLEKTMEFLRSNGFIENPLDVKALLWQK